MIIGVGTDILAMSRLQSIEQNEAFLSRVFTQAERKEAESREGGMLNYFCTRFAGKEAVFKALGISPDGVRLNEIEILTREHGQPYVTLHGWTKEAAGKSGVESILISLSWEKDYAVAFAVACGV